jgi:hypothetical protein
MNRLKVKPSERQRKPTELCENPKQSELSFSDFVDHFRKLWTAERTQQIFAMFSRNSEVLRNRLIRPPIQIDGQIRTTFYLTK